VVAAEPLFRRLEPGRVRTVLVAAAMVLLAWGNWSYKQAEVEPVMPHLGEQTAQVLAEFRAMNPRVPPGAKVVFLDDPWPDVFDMSFIAELWFRDRTTRVFLNRKTLLPPEQIASADAVFTWRDGKLIRVR
jgi:hypothetical protein